MELDQPKRALKPVEWVVLMGAMLTLCLVRQSAEGCRNPLQPECPVFRADPPPHARHDPPPPLRLTWN
jgi:hypothetical protein